MNTTTILTAVRLAACLALLTLPRIVQAQTVASGIVTLADSNIEYFSRGAGETIVLLPGGTLTVGYLDGLAEALAKAGYRVVAINLRGTGKSTGPRRRCTKEWWRTRDRPPRPRSGLDRRIAA